MSSKELEQMFWGLDMESQRLLFIEYGERHGKGALAYAKGRYRKWKSGEEPIAKATLMRMLHLVPKYLSFDERYALLRRILGRVEFSPSTEHFVLDTRNIDSGVADIRERINREVPESLLPSLPSGATSVAEWLCLDDMKIATEILRQAVYAEAKEKKNCALRDLRIFETEVKRNPDHEFRTTFNLLDVDINVRVRRPGIIGRLFGI